MGKGTLPMVRGPLDGGAGLKTRLLVLALDQLGAWLEDWGPSVPYAAARRYMGNEVSDLGGLEKTPGKVLV